MSNDVAEILQEISALRAVVGVPFWQTPEFWIATALGLISVLFSILAFLEARKAKAAATEAGKTVKIQTITIELTEISQRLDKLGMDIKFNEARDLVNEITRRLRRLISPFRGDNEFGETVASLREALHNAKNSLNDVRPTDESENEQAPHVVYYAIEGDLAAINGLVADLLGLCEKRTIETGEKHDNPGRTARVTS